MAWRHLLFGFALAAPLPAAAATYVSVEARWGGSNWESAESDEHPATSNAPVVSGRAYDAQAGGEASVTPQGLPGCGLIPTCATAVPGSGAASARAEANGETGALRARAVAYDSDVFDVSAADSKAEAVARITDTITFNGAAVIGVDLDLDWFLGQQGSTGLIFRIGVPAPDSCPGFNPECSLADEILTELQVFAFDEEGAPFTSGYTLSQFGVEDSVIGDSIPDRFAFDVDLSQLMFPGARTQTLFAELVTYADLAEDGSAGMMADHSAFLKIADYTSASGYGYPGRGATAVVPEPASWALLIAGFAGAGAALRRRRAQPS